METDKVVTMSNDGHFLFNHMAETIIEFFCKYPDGTAMQITHYCNTSPNVRDGRRSYHGIVKSETGNLLRRMKNRGYIEHGYRNTWVRTEKLSRLADVLMNDERRRAHVRRDIMVRRTIPMTIRRRANNPHSNKPDGGR
jgi:hypothetical protein